MKESNLKIIKEGHQYFDDSMWIKFNLLIARNVSLDAAILFGHLYNIESYLLKKKSVYFKSKGYWFICKRDHVKNNINMGFGRQKTAIEELEKSDFIETDLGQGKLKWFRIKWDVVTKKRNEWYSEHIDNKKNKIINSLIEDDEELEYEIPED